MEHLDRDAVLSWVEGDRDPAVVAHLAECSRCRDEAAALHVVLRDVARVQVPEPSPLFWDHLSRRVRERIDAGEAPPVSWLDRAREWRWRGALVRLAPVAAVAVAIVAGWPALHRVATDRSQPAIAAMPSLTSGMAVDDWETVVELVQAYQDEQTAEAGEDVLPEALLVPGAAERAAAELTAEEASELVRLLELEVGQR
jgi:hypothetical protein